MLLPLVRCRLFVQEEPAAFFPTPKRLKSYPADQNRTVPTSRRQLQGRLAGLMPRGRFRMPANTPGGRHPQRSPGFFFPFPRAAIRILSDAGPTFVYIEKAVLRIRDVYPGSEFFSIPDPNFSHHGSASKNLSVVTQKWKYDPGCSSRIRMPDQNPDFLPIPDPDPQHWKKGRNFSGLLDFVSRMC
jgi:hypothetical protein